MKNVSVLAVLVICLISGTNGNYANVNDKVVMDGPGTPPMCTPQFPRYCIPK